jgi:hypothetical protein
MLAASLMTACHGEGAEARRAEAGRITHSVQALRDAPNEGKKPPLAALQREACSADDLCALQKKCVAAYSLEVAALDAVAAVRRAIKDPGPLPTEAANLLGQAKADLDRAQELASTCADLEGAAVRRYSL